MDPTSDLPANLNEAIATEPMWLQAWILIMVVTNLTALLFAVGRRDGRFFARPEAMAIVIAFVAAGALMGWMYEQVGYVRLLGLAHLVFWGPVWLWIFAKRREIGTDTWWGRYAHLYLLIAGISLVIDTVDVIRHLLGDGELWQRWS